VLLTPGTTLNKYAAIGLQVGAVGSKRVGAEWVVALAAAYSTFDLFLWATDGTYYNEGKMRIDYLTRSLQVYKYGTGYANIATLPTVGFAGVVYLPIKLVIDLEDHDYVRAVISDVEYDLSGHVMFYEESSIFQNIYSEVRIYDSDNAAPVCHVAQVILTVNEP